MLRCTGRAYPPTAVRARPRRSGGAHLALPGACVPQFVLLRRCRARPPVGAGLQRRLRLDLRRGRRRHPGRPDVADPVERSLDAARVHGPGAIPGRVRERRMGVRGTVRADRLAGGPVDVGHRARRGCALAGFDRRRRARRLPAPLDGVPGPAGQLLALPAARRWLALARRPRPQGLRSRIRGGRPPRRARDAVPQRRPARPGCAWPGLRLGSLAGLAIGRLPAPCHRVRRRRGVRRAVRPRHGPVVVAPAGRLRVALALDRVGQGPVHPRHLGVEQHHDAGHPRAPPGHGPRSTRREPDRGPDRCAR